MDEFRRFAEQFPLLHQRALAFPSHQHQFDFPHFQSLLTLLQHQVKPFCFFLSFLLLKNIFSSKINTIISFNVKQNVEHFQHIVEFLKMFFIRFSNV